jgi:GMP synthase (glutamine-hydrolysing)
VSAARESAGRALVVTHVPWEGPHRIADALKGAGLTLEPRCVIDGDQLPAPEGLAAAVFMGGPMNVDQVDDYPALLVERQWIAAAAATELPILGVCLGAQLLARALGGDVTAGPAAEIGWRPISVAGADDPMLGHLAPTCEVLHWHGDIISPPPGATALASSAQTELQAFRKGNSWGLLFHAEADLALASEWMSVPEMQAEARAVLGEGADQIVVRAAELDRELRSRSDPMFAEFARLAAGRATSAG